jgi:ubiquinone/menaquinone biosynthesis C-methylase UbiE
MLPLIIQLISGAVCGNIAGAVLQKLNIGALGNSLPGIVGGGLGGHLLSVAASSAASAVGATSSGLDMNTILAGVGGGGVGGAIVMAIVELIKSQMSKSSRADNFFCWACGHSLLLNSPRMPSQCQKPAGWLGRSVIWRMNVSHSKVTDWGLSHISIAATDTILDVGCGGGRTISKLAAHATRGRVYGVDYSEESVTASKKTNVHWIELNRVEVLLGSVSQLPFPDDTFDLVTAVETHFWWPDLPNDFRETFRVVKPGGQILVIAEVYRGATSALARFMEKHHSKVPFKFLTVDEHRDLLLNAGMTDIRIFTEPAKAWISALGQKP